ncbi:hypothetical protein PILCRDRAFT_236059 [Piloderma croceum F 1598]|uniref:Uncharacterized protein n=1 Tax=Piloderma croceum (strain F 1598) TaxID=765440 RepID=A0A0C3BQE4_PILCF|nr:hypothetical protein PILCRDRAFT_236059 [Piloderma croceum F 1598]
MLRQAPPKAPIHHHDIQSISSDTKHKMSKSAPKPRASKQPTIRLKKPANPRKPIPKRSHSPSHSSAEQHYSQTEQVYFQAQPFVPSSFVPSHFFTNPSQNYFVYSADEDVSKVRTMDEISSHPPTPSVFEKLIAQEYMESRLRSPDSLALLQKPSIRTDRQHMSQEERIAFYDFVDSVLGPPCGVQESVGTYKAYMAEQSRLYFERILPDSHDHMRKVQAQTYVRSQTASQAQSSTDSVDFRKWLVSDSSADSSLDDQRSPYSSYGSRVSEVILANSRSDTTGPAEHAPYGAEYNFSGTLDDLFPDVNGNSLRIDEAMGSPVERSVPENWNNFVADEDDVAISPTLVVGSPSTQQTSPDIQSSPVIETPTSVYQQFIQHKNSYFGIVYSSQTAQWTPTLQNDAIYYPANLSPRARFQDDLNVVQKSRESEDMFKYTARPLSVRNILHPNPSEIAKTRTRSSGTHVARMRTSSAGGGM